MFVDLVVFFPCEVPVKKGPQGLKVSFERANYSLICKILMNTHWSKSLSPYPKMVCMVLKRDSKLSFLLILWN